MRLKTNLSYLLTSPVPHKDFKACLVSKRHLATYVLMRKRSWGLSRSMSITDFSGNGSPRSVHTATIILAFSWLLSEGFPTREPRNLGTRWVELIAGLLNPTAAVLTCHTTPIHAELPDLSTMICRKSPFGRKETRDFWSWLVAYNLPIQQLDEFVS